MSVDFDQLKRQACWDHTAIPGHTQGIFTIVDLGPSWGVFYKGEYLNTMSWTGAQPSHVPSVPKEVYLQNANQMSLLGLEVLSELQLRGDGLHLDLSQMLELMTLCGDRIELPSDVSFSSKSYAALKSAVTKAGGSYRNSGFDFDNEATAQNTLTRLIAGECINIKKSLQFYPTTEVAGERLLRGVNLTGKVVFEPSAGDGFLVEQAYLAGAAEVLCAEIYEKFHPAVEQSGGRLIGTDVFQLSSASLSDVDVVLMNPPFSGGQDIKHVRHVLGLIPDQAEVHAIISASVLHNSSKVYDSFRSFLTEKDIELEEMEAGTFKDSGTMTRSCIVRIPPRSAYSAAA